MSDGSFNNPFSGLKTELKSSPSGKSARAKKTAVPGSKKPAPVQTVQDFASEDESASAMFLSAVSSVTPAARKFQTSEDEGLSMAELLATESAKKEAVKEFAIAKQQKKRSPAAPRPEEIPDIKLDNEDLQSFAQAMQGVAPVDGKGGRALAPAVTPPPVRHKSAERDYLTEFTQGKYEFALEYTEEFFEGHVMGLDPLVVAKLRAGQYSPETHIDLHGLNSEQAYTALIDFIKLAYNQGRRNLVVVTGRGKNSPGGLSVLRQNMHDWLTKEPLRRVVLAFCTAQPKDGGAGALYVLLRKYKKNQGKIRWDIVQPGM